ncbi:HNH endonuclease [Salipaludibacillus daqingensis]|uniref:HNH endonuclease n=1 Tax=Salipaludibacillus daqingensis TaxID=3041001 RepID=UPI0024766B20|nr:HNH endonuclease [Salipaludibacillus daqingensis]
MTTQMGRCELCERESVILTEHHLIPKEEGGAHLKTAFLCKPCHKQIHHLYTNKELALRLGTVERLQNDEKIIRFLRFIRKQPSSASIKLKKSNDRKQRKR